MIVAVTIQQRRVAYNTAENANYLNKYNDRIEMEQSTLYRIRYLPSSIFLYGILETFLGAQRLLCILTF